MRLLTELDSVELLVVCANKLFEQKDKSKANAARGRLRIKKFWSKLRESFLTIEKKSCKKLYILNM
jgi:hypothetical protein